MSRIVKPSGVAWDFQLADAGGIEDILGPNGTRTYMVRETVDASGNTTGLAGADDASASTIWLFGTTTQGATAGAGKEKYSFDRLDVNASSVARPTNVYIEQSTNLGVTMTCDFHALDVLVYGGGSNTRYTANVGLYGIEGTAQFTGTNSQTLGKAVGVYGLGKSSSTNGTLSVNVGVQGAVQNSAAGTTTLGAAFYAKSPTVSAGAMTTAVGLYVEDVTAGTANFAIQTNAGQVNFFAGTATPAGGTALVGMTMGSAKVGLYWGSGAPTLSAAQGSIYMRTDGGVNSRLYSNSNGGTTWQPMTNAA